jgi:hypothetical protein
MSGCRGRWFVGPHAVARYIERIAPGLTYEQARARIIEDSERAHRVKVEGDVEHWRGPRPLRVQYRIAPGEGDLPVVLTVLASHVGWRPRC